MENKRIFMDEDQFSAMLAVIVPPIIEYILKNSNVDDEKVILGFYRSKLYQELSDEKSKLWHYSALTRREQEIPHLYRWWDELR